MELEKEIQESIKKNLPQQVSEVLRVRLEQADKDAKKVREVESRVDCLNQEVMRANEKLLLYKEFDTRNSLLESAQKELETERNSLELEKLKYQLQAEKDKTQFSQNLAMGLVRNTEYKKTIFDSENVGGLPVMDGQGYSHYPIPTNKHHTSTETLE
jgi:hypothetical protein